MHARRVKAVEAAIRLVGCLGRSHCGMKIGEITLDLLNIERCAVVVSHQVLWGTSSRGLTHSPNKKSNDRKNEADAGYRGGSNNKKLTRAAFLGTQAAG